MDIKTQAFTSLVPSLHYRNYCWFWTHCSVLYEVQFIFIVHLLELFLLIMLRP